MGTGGFEQCQLQVMDNSQSEGQPIILSLKDHSLRDFASAVSAIRVGRLGLLQTSWGRLLPEAMIAGSFGIDLG